MVYGSSMHPAVKIELQVRQAKHILGALCFTMWCLGESEGNTMRQNYNLPLNKNAVAWVLMISAIGLHVFDEVVTHFLSFYNELALNLRESVGFSLMPTFTFGAWLGGLIIAIIICFALTPLVIRGGRFIRAFATLLGILMVVNALGHMIGSAYLGRLLPGFWSSPILLVTAVFVVVRGFSGPRPVVRKIES
jgi:hypothetical protein